MKQEEFQLICERAPKQLDALKALRYDGFLRLTEIERTVHEFTEAGKKLLAENDTLQIGIVGQVKAGKSSFLNSLFFDGENILPRASTPMTAGLTILEYNEENSFEVDYFTRKDWEIFQKEHDDYEKIAQECRAQDPNAPESVLKKEIESRTTDSVRSSYEMVSACSLEARKKIDHDADVVPFKSIADLQDVLEKYVGANGTFTSVVKSLRVKIKDERLKGLRIVDTPGVNDPVVSREERTRTFLKSCHGVFLLSASSDFFGQTDVQFLNQRIGGEGIGAVVVLASKFDSVLQDLGADRSMKGLAPQDLGRAAEAQFQAFNRRLDSLKDTVDAGLRDRLALNYTSGISFSLAQKDEAKWDATECTVAKQMQRYYPDAFTPQNQKSSFVALANIEEIREQHLEKEFRAKKTEIINERVANFFEANKQQVVSLFGEMNKDLQQKRNLLNATTIEEVQKQLKTQEQLFKKVEEQIKSRVGTFSQGLQTMAQGINNKVSLSTSVKVPTEQCSASIRHKGWLWGHNTTTMYYQGVNSYELKKEVERRVEDYCKQFNNEWERLFKELSNKFTEEALEVITEQAQKMVGETAFDDDFYREQLHNVVRSLTYNAQLNLRSVQDGAMQALDSTLSAGFLPSGYDSMKKSAAETALQNDARSYINNLESQIAARVLRTLPEDIKQQVNSVLNSVTPQLANLKNEFGNKLKKECDDYMHRLGEELKEKEKSLQELDRFIAAFTTLKNTLENRK